LKAPKLRYVRARALDEVFAALAAEGEEVQRRVYFPALKN